MKQTVKGLTSLLLCAAFLFSCAFGALAATEMPSDTAWQEYWSSYVDEGAAVTLAPGGTDSERCVGWYSASSDEPAYVEAAENENMSGAVRFEARQVQTNQGDVRNIAEITGLEPGKTYYYRCCAAGKTSEVYSFKTDSSKDFTALYVTDVHISSSEEDENAVREHAYKWNSVLEQASEKSDLSLVVSAGDQASLGLRCEYEGFVAPLAARSVPFATTVGNHDIKYTDYKAFHTVPNENTKALVSNYISADYYFVKGNALFLMLDSNCQSMSTHRSFIKKAIKDNPDVKWRIMMFHHDLYGGRIPHRESENGLLRTLYTPLADEFSIDLVLLGHSHYYTISNVMYHNKTVSSTEGLSKVTDPNGTIYMVSGSINRPRSIDEEEIPPLGENAGQSYLTDEIVYNLLDFTENSITVNSYTLESNEKFNTFTIEKTSQKGGHDKASAPFYEPFVRVIADIYAFFDRIVRSIEFYFNYVK